MEYSEEFNTRMENPEEINLREVMEYYGYTGSFGVIKFYFRYAINWILQTIAKICPHFGISVKLQRMRGVKIGKHVFLGPGVNIDDLYPELITIEDYVGIGMGTMIFAHSNPTCSPYLKKKYYPREVKPVTIKSGAWIAPGSIILAGITIGEHSVVGAGSVVMKNVEPYTVVVGCPARVLKKLE
ncbi:acetyltransferase [Methanosarcina sp. WH1]|uniref:acyltransferase n=2 Tax=unclassified Methanosarcina TaxID=2644672 RepID=UPI000615DFE2|nr:acetyltransferase [Methanosarcina sp. WH1]AKB19819.1 Acetyltransferase (isoleucine patch superfamily) [Methanosarcina sp. WWM596]AKB22413.1 Acetyltransferase (isoleucine patch superfamily) [Methanosarcina sp. WH1]